MKVHEHSRHVSSIPHGGRAPRLLAAGFVAGLVMGLAVAGAVTAHAAQPFGPWRAELLRDNPLVGRMVDAKTLKPLSRAAVERRLASAPIVILGEVHDNPDHHRIQAALLRAFARGRAKPPAVIFEMIPTDKAGALSALRGAKKLTAGAVFDIVDWDHSGWPKRAIYAPVMKAAVETGGLPVPAGLPKDQVRPLARKGVSMLDAERRAELKLAPLPAAQQKAMEKEIVKSHCDMIPASAAKAMSHVQRVRDALMGKALHDGWKTKGSAVLIAGDGHARKDRAAPFYLARHEGAPRPLVVWLAEVNEKDKTVRDVLPKDANPEEIADIIIITPRARREDPCARFKRFMDHKKKGKKGKKG